MKRITILTTAIFFLVAGLTAFAADGITTRLLGRTTIEQSFYNAFGVAVNSTRTITSTVETTNTQGDNIITSTTTTTQTITSSWRGDGIKIDQIGVTSNTTSDDQSSSSSTSNVTYSYDNQGRLDGATGGAENTSYAEEQRQMSRSTTTDDYIIIDGQALVNSSGTTGDTKTNVASNNDAGWNAGTLTNHFQQDSTNVYELKGGERVLMSSSTHAVSTGQGASTGSSSDITRTTSYVRDNNGVLTDLTLAVSGTRTTQNNGGSITESVALTNSIVRQDPQQGYYIASETLQWTVVPSSNTGGGSGGDSGGDSVSASSYDGMVYQLDSETNTWSVYSDYTAGPGPDSYAIEGGTYDPGTGLGYAEE